jgi:signal transduction histidine kinase
MKGRKTGALYLLSVATIALLIWGTILSIRQPYTGVFWEYSTGIIYEVDGTHPSAYQIHKGDQVISGEGHPAHQVYRLISGRVGETITLVINRGGHRILADMQLLAPDIKLLVSRLIPILIALAFSIAGGVIYAFSRVSKQNIQFFLFCQTLAVTLGAGAISSFSDEWVKLLFQLGLVWSGFFAIHLHTIFPTGISFRFKKPLLILISSGAVLLTILIFMSWFTARSISLACLIYLGISFLIVLFLWSQSLFKAGSAGERKQAGILAFSWITGLSPLVIFSIIPNILMGVTLLPYEISMASLILLPVGYGYAIKRYKIGIDQKMHRGATYAFVMLVMAGIFAVSYSLEQRVIGDHMKYHPVWELTITLALVASTRLIYNNLTVFTEKLLYGSWYDYRTVVHRVSSSLKTQGYDPTSIAKVICQSVGSSMQLEYAAIVLYDGWFISYQTGKELQIERQPNEILDLLCRAAPGSTVEINNQVRSELAQSLQENGIQMEMGDHVQFIIPLHGSRDLLGVFVLGNKIGRGEVNRHDREILESVFQQARIGIENARLLDELQKHTEMIERMHQRVVQVREGERKRVSRDLHDLIIQSLVGLSFQVKQMHGKGSPLADVDWAEMQNEIARIVEEARRICTALRPASLEVVGLVSTIETRIAELEEHAPFLIRLVTVGSEKPDLPEDVVVTLYRFFNESMINIQKHAQADQVKILVEFDPNEIRMNIEDNGQGFTLPENLEDLTVNQHFGLVGQQELLAMVNGSLRIVSRPGEGCSITATVPLMD